jgi:dihydroorotase
MQLPLMQALARVTCDVAAHHLHLSENDIGWFDPHCRFDPPLRGDLDRDALRAGLADGTIDALCSDHTPVDDDAKQAPFADAEPGATGLELLLPLTLKWATEMKVPLVKALARVTSEPARIMGVPAGTLLPGAAADICVFDPEATVVISRETLKSQGKNTPLLGREFRGRVRCTLIEGHLAYHDEMA